MSWSIIRWSAWVRAWDSARRVAIRQQRFRYNIVADCDRQVEIYVQEDDSKRDINHNCYWSSARSDLKTVGEDDIVSTRNSSGPQWKDYRLANDSPCAKLTDEAVPCGAFGLIGDAPRRPRPAGGFGT